jgi:hypothetical protein
MILPPAAAGPKPPRTRRRPLWPWLLLLALGIACAVLAYVLVQHHNGSGKSPAAGGTPIALTGISGYDPYGDHNEHDSDAYKATDGLASTFWTTEHYFDAPSLGGKPGVGLVLDAGQAADVKHLTVTSDTPGFTAEIQEGNSAGGPFTTVSGSKVVGAQTTFAVSGAHDRYYVIWITALGDHESADVNEVTASS